MPNNIENLEFANLDEIKEMVNDIQRNTNVRNYVSTNRFLNANSNISGVGNAELRQRVQELNKAIGEASESNLEQIRQTSNELYNRKGFYWSCVQFLTNLLTLDYMLIPRFAFVEENRQRIEKARLRVQEYCDDILDKSHVREMLKDIIIDGCYFGVERQDGKNWYMQKLDNDYCRKGSLIVRGLNTVEFNFSYFDDKDEEHFELFPSEFKSLYNDYQNDSESDEPEWRMLDPDYSLCLLTEDSRVPLPMFTRIFAELLETEEYFSNLNKVNDNDTFKLLQQKIPFDEKNGITKISSQVAGQFHKMVKSLVPDGVDVVTTPMEIKEIKTNVSKSEREVGIDKMNERLNQSAGVSPYIFNMAQNVSGITANINHNTNVIHAIIEKFEFWLKKRLDKFPSSKFRYKVEYFKTNTINRQEMFDMHNVLLSYGGALEPLLSIAGINPDSYIGLLEMENALGIKDKLKITQSVHTANTTVGNEGGRPSDKNSETGEEAKDKGTNEEATM